MAEKPTYEELEQRIKEFENAESERKRAEEALQKAHDELEQRVEERTVDLKKKRDFNKLLIQSSPVFFIAIDPDGKIMMVNDALLDAQKYTNDEVIGKYFLSFIPEREHSELLKRFEKLSSHHEIASGENYLLTKDGREIFTEWHNRLVFDKNGELDFVFGFGFDITDRRAKEEELRKHREHLEELIKERTANLKITNEQLKKEIKDRKKTEDALRESEVRLAESNQLLAGVLEHTHMMAVFLDPRFNFIWVNHAYADTCNQEPSFFPGKNHFDLYPHEENQAIFQRVVDTGESFFVAAKPFEFPDQPKRGVTYWDWSLIPVKDGTGKVTGLVFTLAEVTERIQAEEERDKFEFQLRQTQKMDAIATLAGGIAHEFNNALTSVIGNSQLLEMDFPDNKTVTGYTEAMMSSSHRMANLTSQLLAYSQGGRYQAKTISLNNFVEDALHIIKPNVDPSIRLETGLPRDVFSVKADPAQMQMVLSAIVGNSSEAIEGEGRIRIITSNKEIDATFAKNHPELNPGNYVCLTVEDDGKGMDAETLNKIFDPFYTTKFMGRGLGMAAVYGIIRNHKGWITVDSELNKGTIIRIYLPAIKAEDVKKATIVESATEMPKGEGTILIIEDEEEVMNVIRAVLERLGYRMLEAKTGREAVEIAETFDGDIALAILDIKLPDIQGDKVYPLIMKARPNLKVIVCSGYSIDIARGILDAGAQDFIQKPFNVKDLSQKLRKILEKK